MGYVHGREWKDGDVEKDILKMVKSLNLDRFPTKKEMIDFYGNGSLASKISRTGGSKYYASLLNLKIKDCESEFGGFYEDYTIDNIREHTGLSSVQMDVKYPYDILTDGNIKVDVKSSKKLYKQAQAMPYFTFNLEKKNPTCDIFVFYCLDDELFIDKTIIVPSCLIAGKTQVGMGGLSKWDAYSDRWDYFKMYSDFYKNIKSTEIIIPKRRSKPE